MSETTQKLIETECNAIRDMLIEKNRSYGDSALHPVGIFASGRAVDLIKVRIDDKLNRIRNAPDAFGEDVVGDLIGYLVLLKLALKQEGDALTELEQFGGLVFHQPQATVGPREGGA